MRHLLAGVAVGIIVLAPLSASAQTVVQDQITVERAQVTDVLSSKVQDIPGTQTSEVEQTINATVLSGPDAGTHLTLTNDYLEMSVGDQFYVRHDYNAVDGTDQWAVLEPYRLPVLWALVGVFVLCLALFGGKQGIRGLFSLIVGFFFIYLLLSGILAGYSPLWLALGISSLIIVAGSYVTHGFNRTTSAAVIGMIATILLTGLLAYATVHMGQFSGYTSEEATYLNFDTNGSINFVGLLLGSLLIGFLGVLYDAAIGQAVAVEELAAAAAHYTPRDLWSRGMRIGREHIGALVNTLAIAYVGASLPLLLLLKLTTTQSIWVSINSELFATEIVRILIGSIGLILAVPITTLIAVYMLHGKIKTPRQGGEGHGHSHVH